MFPNLFITADRSMFDNFTAARWKGGGALIVYILDYFDLLILI